MSFFEEISPFFVLRLSRLVGEKKHLLIDLAKHIFQAQNAQAGVFLFSFFFFFFKSRVM